MTPIVRDAIRDLDLFRVDDPAMAVVMLSMWARYGDMSADDITAVLDHYRKVGAR